ncbi:Apolipoprotein Eb [Bagarius yarrelli]|uniref:Apolipoprotein Eb n=1 Tax=Bagarius yarrelli TaxID=175774 RepID=A0A556U8P5_BAGYA|nr:Apolipoprotein Eb [Bagarius yarrelli]
MGIKVYFTTVTASREVKSQQAEVMRILESKNIQFELVDIAVGEEVRSEMRTLSGNPNAAPPQIFNGDQYCGGRFLFQDEPKTHWEEMVDKFWEYVNSVSATAENMKKSIQDTKIGKELDTLISDSMAELQMYTDDVQSKLAPHAKETAERVHNDLKLLSNKLHIHMQDAKDRITEYSQELQTMVEQNADEIESRFNAYIRKLKKRLNKDTQEIKKRVETYFKEVQDRTAQLANDMNERLKSYSDVIRQNAEDKFNFLKDLLKDQANQVMEKLENMKNQAEKIKSNLYTPFQQKMEEVKNWFQQFIN